MRLISRETLCKQNIPREKLCALKNKMEIDYLFDSYDDFLDKDNTPQGKTHQGET